MDNNLILQKKIEDALDWEPQLKTSNIRVAVKDGVVTLAGTVDNYFTKSEAEKATKKVVGVKAIVEKIEVKSNEHTTITDNDIAEKLVKAFKSSFSVPDGKIIIEVEKGWVTLQGEVNWNYQKEAAKNIVANLLGVRGITNNIQTKSEHKDIVRRVTIEKALNDNAALKENQIIVTVKDADVTLSGLVKTYFEKEEAERIAWKTPGVWSVTNLIGVDSFN